MSQRLFVNTGACTQLIEVGNSKTYEESSEHWKEEMSRVLRESVEKQPRVIWSISEIVAILGAGQRYKQVNSPLPCGKTQSLLTYNHLKYCN